jgi:hypothetical protein
MRQAIFALFAAIIILGVGVAAVQSQYQDSVRGGGIQEDFEESVTASYSSPVNVSASNVSGRVYDAEVDVFDNQSTLVEPDGNYSWNENGFGRLNISSSSNVISDGESINVSYGYNVPTGEQQTARDVGTLPAQLGEVLILLFGAFVLFAVMVRMV